MATCSKIYSITVNACADFSPMVWVPSGEFGNGTGSGNGASGIFSGSGEIDAFSSGGNLDGSMLHTWAAPCDCIVTVNISSSTGQCDINLSVEQDGNPVLTKLSGTWSAGITVLPFTLAAGVATAITVHWDYVASAGTAVPPPAPAETLSVMFTFAVAP